MKMPVGGRNDVGEVGDDIFVLSLRGAGPFLSPTPARCRLTSHPCAVQVRPGAGQDPVALLKPLMKMPVGGYGVIDEAGDLGYVCS